MIHELKETKMQSRLDIILETVDMILEGSKRKWSKEKRLKHAEATSDAEWKRFKRLDAAREIHYMRQDDDLGRRGHPVNIPRYDARRKLGDMPGTGEEISGRRKEEQIAFADAVRTRKRVKKMRNS